MCIFNYFQKVFKKYLQRIKKGVDYNCSKGTKGKKKMKKMITDNSGISYYKIGKRYFQNSGWLEKEITKEFYEIKVNQIINELR